MPSFDIVSEVDLQEVRDAVDQANREADPVRLQEHRLDHRVRRGGSPALLHRGPPAGPAPGPRREDRAAPGALKAFEAGKIEEAAKGTARMKITIRAGIDQEHAKRLNRFIKDLGLKGVTSQTQGDQLRVTGKKRDDLQAVIAACKAEDFGIPLQFDNFRD